MSPSPPRILTIAGSDSSAGAGIQADLKTIAALGGYGFSAVTAVTAQTTDRVVDVHLVPVDSVRQQVDAALSIGVDAVKLGMLADEGTAAQVVLQLSALTAIPIVLDPILVASDGTSLGDVLGSSAFDGLLRLATVTTPNLTEAAALLGCPLESPADQRWAAAELARRTTAAVLLTGGQLVSETVTDLLCCDGAYVEIVRPRIEGGERCHGTGCTLSAALAVFLARGLPLPEAATAAVDYVRSTMTAALQLGGAATALDHFAVMKARGQRL